MQGTHGFDAWSLRPAGAPPVLPVAPDLLPRMPRRTEPLVRTVPLREATGRALMAADGTLAAAATEIGVAAVAVLVLRYVGQTDVLVALLRDEPAVMRLRVRGDQSPRQARRAAAAAIGRAARPGPPGPGGADDPVHRAPHETGSAPCHAVVAVRGGRRTDGDELRFADLVLVLQPVHGRLRAALVANAALYEPGTAARLAAHLGRIVDALAAPDSAQTLATLPLLGAAEREQIMVGWNDTVEELPDAHLSDLVAEEARARPDAPAMVHDAVRLSYAELDADANRLANHLIGLGVRPGDVIGVLMPRRAEHLVAQLATWRTGATVLLLDPDQYEKRLEYALADLPLVVLLTTADAAHRLDAAVEAPVVVVDTEPAWRSAPAVDPGRRLRDGDVSHIAYTAGTTGPPKAVLMRHGSMRNTMHALRRECAITRESRGTWLSSPGLGLIQADVLPVLAAGATVYIPGAEPADSVAELREWLVRNEITHTLVGVGRAEALWAMSWPTDCALRSMRVVGRQVPSWPPPGLPFTVLNVYGSAETNVVATCDLTTTAAALDADQRALRRPPVGRPVSNVRAYVLGERHQPVPPGVVGELHVSGSGLARGYLGRPDATEARFRANPFPEDPNPVLYRTGDLTRYWPNGVIEMVGRLDGPGRATVPASTGEAGGRTVTRRIAALFADVLGARSVGGRDDFFTLGGDDARAERLLTALYAEFGATVTIADLRRAPTVDGLARLVVRTWLGAAPPTIVPHVAGRHLPFPLTPAQRRLWLASGRRPGPRDLYEWGLARPDAERLGRGWREVVARHDALRTVVLGNGEQVASSPPGTAELVDLTGMDPVRACDHVVGARRALREPAAEPALRISLLSDGSATVQLAVSPLLVDHESMHRVVIPALASAAKGEPASDPAPGIAFRDYARNSLTRWSQHDVDSAPPAGRPPGRPGCGTSVCHELPFTLVERLRSRCAAAATELGDAVVAALHDVLAEADLTPLGSTDVPISLVQRTGERVLADPAVERLVGCFTVWRRLRLEANDNPTFADRARAVARCPTEAAPIRCAVEVAVAVEEPGPAVPVVLSTGPLADATVRVVLDTDALRTHWTAAASADPATVRTLAGAFADRLARYATDDGAWWEGVDAFNKAYGQGV